MSLDFFHFLIHCSVNSSSPATTLPAAWAIYFPKTCTTNAALHVRTYRPLVAFSAYFTWMRFLTVNSTIDTFTLKVEQGWKRPSKLCHSIPEPSLILILLGVLTSWISTLKSRILKRIIDIHVPSHLLYVDGPQCFLRSVQIPFQQDLMWLLFVTIMI